MKGNEQVDPKQMLALEEELIQLKQQYGIGETERGWKRLVDRIVNKLDREGKTVSRSRYIRLALSCGWFSGAHRFYAGKRVSGILYLLFCWTGIPFAMTLIDLMIAVPMQTDDMGMIQV